MEGPSVLALGGHQKATVTLLTQGQAVVSQHLGDLSSLEGVALLEATVRDLLDFFHVEPVLLACDLHPDYASTRYARGLDIPVVAVQHHYAHALSCLADNGSGPPALGVTWDGSGWGGDGTVWGGEFLRVTPGGYSRFAHRQCARHNQRRIPWHEEEGRDLPSRKSIRSRKRTLRARYACSNTTSHPRKAKSVNSRRK